MKRYSRSSTRTGCGSRRSAASSTARRISTAAHAVDPDGHSIKLSYLRPRPIAAPADPAAAVQGRGNARGADHRLCRQGIRAARRAHRWHRAARCQPSCAAPMACRAFGLRNRPQHFEPLPGARRAARRRTRRGDSPASRREPASSSTAPNSSTRCGEGSHVRRHHSRQPVASPVRPHRRAGARRSTGS